jgi:hypothetical protein
MPLRTSCAAAAADVIFPRNAAQRIRSSYIKSLQGYAFRQCRSRFSAPVAFRPCRCTVHHRRCCCMWEAVSASIIFMLQHRVFVMDQLPK